MRSYELVLVIKTALSEAQRKKLIDTVISWFKESKVTKEQSLGQKVLSYPIKKEDSGFYVLFSLESETGVTPDFEKKILQNDNILRHLLIRKR